MPSRLLGTQFLTCGIRPAVNERAESRPDSRVSECSACWCSRSSGQSQYSGAAPCRHWNAFQAPCARRVGNHRGGCGGRPWCKGGCGSGQWCIGGRHCSHGLCFWAQLMATEGRRLCKLHVPNCVVVSLVFFCWGCTAYSGNSSITQFVSSCFNLPTTTTRSFNGFGAILNGCSTAELELPHGTNPAVHKTKVRRNKARARRKDVLIMLPGQCQVYAWLIFSC